MVENDVHLDVRWIRITSMRLVARGAYVHMYFESTARHISSFNMADDESSSTSDDSLDVTSVKFDPIKALYSTKMQLSCKKAPIYDNIFKFEGVMTGLTEKSKVRIARMARALQFAVS